MHTVTAAREQRRDRGDAARAGARARRGRRRHRLHRPGAAAAARRAIRRVALTAAMSSGADRRRGGCRRCAAVERRRSRRSMPEALARDADVVFLALPDTAAAELAPRAGRRRRPRHRSVRRVPAARRGGARALVSGDAPRCRTAWPTASPSASAAPSRARGWSPTRAAIRPRRCWRSRRWPTPACSLPSADIIVDAKSGVSGAGKTPSERTHFSEVHGSLSAYGVFGHRHGAEIEQGARPRGHVHAASACRSIAAFWRRSTCAWRRARPRRRSATSSSSAYAGAPFVRLVGAALPEIKHVAHTNFCDIGWRVDPSGRVDSRVGHRQPAEGRVGPGRAEHERDARRRRAAGAAVTGAAGPEVRRRAARGSRAAATVVAAPSRGIAAARRAGRRRARRRQGDRRRAEGRRHREAAGRRPAHHRRADARRRRRGAGRRGQHAVRRGADHRRRRGGRADRRRRGLRAVEPRAAASHGRRAAGRSRARRHPERRRRHAASLHDAGRPAVRAGRRLHRARRDGRLFNVNADTFAGHLAARLGARRLVIAGTTPGVLDERGATVPVLEPAAHRAADRRRHGHGRDDRQAARVRARAGRRRRTMW